MKLFSKARGFIGGTAELCYGTALVCDSTFLLLLAVPPQLSVTLSPLAVYLSAAALEINEHGHYHISEAVTTIAENTPDLIANIVYP